MTGQRAMVAVLALAVLSIAGIVGMLVVESGAWDGALFAVAALPLLAGGYACWTRRAGA
jgi:hypothetical protein